MIAKFETRQYINNEQLWTGVYSNLHNLPHWHTEFEIIHVFSGNAIISINDQSFSLNESQTLFVSGGDIHSIQSINDSKIAVCLFDKHLMKEISSHYSLVSPFLKYSYPFKDAFKKIQKELELKPILYELKAKHILQELLLMIFRNEELKQTDYKSSHIAFNRYKELLNELDEKYSDMTFKDCATFMGFSEAYFSRFFKQISGMTFSQYRNIIRIEKAIQLIQSENELTISQITFKCGFGTPRHFNRVFLETTGYSPSSLPADFKLNSFPLKAFSNNFDPTLNDSILLE